MPAPSCFFLFPYHKVILGSMGLLLLKDAQVVSTQLLWLKEYTKSMLFHQSPLEGIIG